MKRGFTMIELLLAVSLLGVITAITMLSFYAVTNGWRVSREYLDTMERTDYAIDQLVTGLKCAYYPHTGGGQDYAYGFALTDNGDGDSPRDSDMIEWTKKGTAMIGSSAVGDSVHRIQVMVLEKGDRTWGEEIKNTGLYARVKPLAKVIPGDEYKEEEDFTFENDELYRPVLVAANVDGFNCRVIKTEPEDDGSKNAKADKSDYEDEFAESNSVPYKLQLTFYVPKEDPEYRSQSKRVPIMRTLIMPIHAQSLDGAALPSSKDSKR